MRVNEAQDGVPARPCPENPGSTPSPSDNHEKDGKASKLWYHIRSSRVYGFLSWTPPRCRWDPERPSEFSMGLNVLFAFAGCFTVANLYYSHPILNILADEFGVKYEKVSQIPTLSQAGYAAGLLLLCPLGDLFKRRPFVLLLVLFTATSWIGLCVTKSFAAFSAISFITGFTTVTPQLMLPLVGDLAPPHRRAAALSVVVSGMTLGILLARVLSGVLADYTSWRNNYWMACGLQYLIFFLLWLFMPDYPSTNPGGLNYFKMLWSILVMLTKFPVLIQSCILAFLTAATFTNFWTTLTFLLAGPPYNYPPLPIGLFGLIGILSMFFSPIYARLVMDKFVPWISVFVGETMVLVAVVIGTYTGQFTIAGPVIQAIVHDAGLITAAIANRSTIYSLAPKGRNRVNTAFMLATFCGQLTGTAAGNHVYASGGWIHSGSLSVGLIVGAFLFLFSRGPYESGWVGWRGGYSMKKKDKNSADGMTAEEAMHTKGVEKGKTDAVPADIEKAVDEMAMEEDGGIKEARVSLAKD
ncbi:MFS general substrate transporter [Tothia fuscella]|uniref:MFS general substrate transporter n=1 Tax=Tothia fuscella TaxID=1048955 RepID=A0A9P4NV72_9PEZI|nr:MFS general substrate transporter [Tothia fuscella]